MCCVVLGLVDCSPAENAPKMVLEGPIKCDDDKLEEDSLQRLFQRVRGWVGVGAWHGPEDCGAA